MSNRYEFWHRSVLDWGNRGWLEIINSILQTCLEGALKTHIMYECNLNSRQVSHYLEHLETLGLIERRQLANNKWEYRTTEKARKYLEAYRVLHEIFSVEGRPGEK